MWREYKKNKNRREENVLGMEVVAKFQGWSSEKGAEREGCELESDGKWLVGKAECTFYAH